MPKIEIIPVRFNLDKEDDRKLFEEVQKHSSSGKRNEFLKQVLYDYLMKGGTTAVRAKPALKKQLKEKLGDPVKLHAAELLELEHPLSSTSEGGLEPVAATYEGAQASGEHETPAEASSEAAGLAASFVQ